MVSVVGWMTGAFLGQPRVIHAMADRGELPRIFAAVHSRFRTPAPAILLFAGVSLALAFAGSFAANATFAAIVRMVYYGLTCAALIVLRKKGGEPAGFRLRGGPVIAVLAVGFCALAARDAFVRAGVDPGRADRGGTAFLPAREAEIRTRMSIRTAGKCRPGVIRRRGSRRTARSSR